MKIRSIKLYCRPIMHKNFWWNAHRYESDPYYGGPVHMYDFGPFTLAIRVKDV